LHVSADVLWLTRSRADRQTIVSNPLGALTPDESLNVHDLLFNVEAGVRGQVAYEGETGHGMDVGYIGIFDQASTATLLDTDMFFDFFSRQPATATSAYTVTYESDLHSGELNWRLPKVWRVRPSIGARWIRHAEDFSILDTAEISEDAFADLTNDLVGGQIGLRTVLWDRGGWFRVEASLKGGAYRNSIELHADARNTANVVQASLDYRTETTAFSGEATVSAIWQFHRNVSLRVGYQGLWLTEIALVPDQSNDFSLATGTGGLEVNDIGYQGGHCGLEVRW
jgi:hypothetical protein